MKNKNEEIVLKLSKTQFKSLVKSLDFLCDEIGDVGCIDYTKGNGHCVLFDYLTREEQVEAIIIAENGCAKPSALTAPIYLMKLLKQQKREQEIK